MMTPKEALAKDGTVPVKQGKGRLSKDGDKRCRELAAEGWNIKGYSVSSTPATTEKSAEKVVKKVNPSAEKVVQDYTILYDERDFKAVGVDKKVWSMREVCNTCRVSLVQNICEHPTILGGIPVTIVPK